MINQIIANIQQDLTEILTETQLEALSQVLNKHLSKLATEKPAEESAKQDMLPLFIAAKRVEGCSEKSLRYYESTIRNMLEAINKPECQITTEDLRGYLDTYQRRGTVSKVTLDNVRRILSSFFAWLEDEDYIVKSPVRRIHKVKTGKTVKETYSDESLELMRDHCDNTRDLAMIDLLSSTGIRVGELVKLNRSDVDFESRECIVFGKGTVSVRHGPTANLRWVLTVFSPMPRPKPMRTPATVFSITMAMWSTLLPLPRWKRKPKRPSSLTVYASASRI